MFKYMICDYIKDTVEDLLAHYNVLPCNGFSLREQRGFARKLIEGLDEDAEMLGHDTIYDELI